MSDPQEREASAEEPLPEVDQGAYAPGAVPLEPPWPNQQPVPDGVAEVSQDPGLFVDDDQEGDE